MGIIRVSFKILAGIFFSLQAFSECDPNALLSNLRSERDRLEIELSGHLKENEEYAPDLKSYAGQIEEFNQCMVGHGYKAFTCRYFDLRVDVDLGADMYFQKLFQISDRPNQKCFVEMKNATTVRSSVTGEQIVSTFGGMHILNNEPACTSKDNLAMGRSMVLSDSSSTSGVSGFFTLDLGVPLENYLVSQFWGVEYPVGTHEKVLRDIVDNNLRLRYTNGAEIVIEPTKRQIISSNFLHPSVYNYTCKTDHDGASGSKRKYWPVMQIVDGGGSFVGKPKIIKANALRFKKAAVQDLLAVGTL